LESDDRQFAFFNCLFRDHNCTAKFAVFSGGDFHSQPIDVLYLAQNVWDGLQKDGLLGLCVFVRANVE
jgi:hypothetical protein